VRVTPHLRALMDPLDPEDPIRRQFLPSPAEASVGPGESEDPLGERGIEAAPRLLHRYPDRVLLLVTDRCAAYCRFCFRRESAGRGGRPISDRELRAAAAYVGAHPEVREIILSGGDPLTLPGRRLSATLEAFRGREPAASGSDSTRKLGFRIHTRVPVVAPGRLTPELVERLKEAASLRVVLHVNHPRELGRRCLEAVLTLQAAGVPVLSQGVLLKGVNDEPGTLAELWLRLAEAGIGAHHLFHPDLARGTAHFRVNLERALRVYREAAAMAAAGGRAAAVPRFSLDLPGGGGKVSLQDCRILRESRGFYRVETPDGRSGLYPVDESGPGTS